jgi:hypothetical protein
MKTRSEKFLIPGITPHVILNKAGEKVGVFFEIQDYEKLVDEVEDFLLGAVATAIKQKKEKTVSLDKIQKKLKLKK